MRTAAELQAQITKIETAIDSVLLGQEYTLDTGMTKQVVKRANLKELQDMLNMYESQLSVAILKEGGCQITRGISC